MRRKGTFKRWFDLDVSVWAVRFRSSFHLSGVDFHTGNLQMTTQMNLAKAIWRMKGVKQVFKQETHGGQLVAR